MRLSRARTDGFGSKRCLRFAAGFLVLTLAGCGGGDDGESPDATAPTITGGPTAEAWGDSARIQWTTDEPADSRVRYGLDLSYGELRTLAADVVEHEVLLGGLTLDTTYYYVCESTDAAGNGPTVSDGDSFVTEPTAQLLTAQGWTLFESGEFAGAATAFVRAQGKDPSYADAWSGGGWVRLRQGRREEAQSDFEQCLSLDEHHWDAAAGLAVVLAALGDKESSIPWCTAILDAEGETYEFDHDSEVTSRTVRILLAENYVYLLDFESALTQVRILDPSVELDAGDPETWGMFPTFESALLAQIEALDTSAGT